MKVHIMYIAVLGLLKQYIITVNVAAAVVLSSMVIWLVTMTEFYRSLTFSLESYQVCTWFFRRLTGPFLFLFFFVLLFYWSSLVISRYYHRNDLAHQPHKGRFQQDISISSSVRIPSEVILTVADNVHTRVWAVFVPESTAIAHCTVILVAWTGILIVVTVISGEHHILLVPKCVASVTWVSRNPYLVIGCLMFYNEGAVQGIIPDAIACLQIKSQLVAAVGGQITQQFVAEPVVASRAVESNFKLRPGTVEEVGSVCVLLD